MLIVSKKKLLATRIIMWGGIGLAALGAILFYISSDTFGTASIALLAGGLIVSLLGATCMKRLFRCPNCRKSVLGSDSGVDLRTSNCPSRCPHCGAEVRVEE
ncbi:MAG: hypothetical protein ACI3XJ_08345 [Oscillospiraceae bacterium]